MSDSSRRSAAVRRNRPRGIYVPTDEVSGLLACGWRVLDDCPQGLGRVTPDECLLQPPAVFREEAA